MLVTGSENFGRVAALKWATSVMMVFHYTGIACLAFIMFIELVHIAIMQNRNRRMTQAQNNPESIVNSFNESLPKGFENV